MNCKICGKEINEEFQKCNNIGYGSYSTIYLVCNANKPKYVIKKLFDKTDIELDTCNKINYINNVLFTKYITTINNDSIIYQYINGDSLNNYIYSNCETDRFINIVKNLVKQLYNLEKQNYYHLDINLNNIIVSNDQPYIIDYGTLTNTSDERKEYYGSYSYIPPEYLLDKNLIINKFDVFSIGIILFNKVAGFNPFNLSKYYKMKCWFWCKDELCKDRGKCLYKYMENKSMNITNKEIFNIIVRCLEFDPERRFTLKELNDAFEKYQ